MQTFRSGQLWLCLGVAQIVVLEPTSPSEPLEIDYAAAKIFISW